MNSLIKQVNSLPSRLRETAEIIEQEARAILTSELIYGLNRIYITGCGDSHHAGLTTRFAFEKLTGLPTSVMTALEFARYQAGFLKNNNITSNLVIGISVSGSVARTYEALLMAKGVGATTLSLTASADSRVAQAGDVLFHVPNPHFDIPEGEVSPGVRSFFTNQVALLLMAIQIGEVRGTLSKTEANQLRKELVDTANVIENTIQENDAKIFQTVQKWIDARDFVFLGSGPNYGTALFSAAKILEASGDPAMGQDTEEWAHLQYFAREIDTPTICITAAERDVSRMDEVVFAAKQLGRRVAVICPATAQEMIEKADVAFTFSPVEELFSALVTQVPGELFAAYRADLINEPFFRNFEGGRHHEDAGGVSRIQTSTTWNKWLSG